MVQQGYFTIHGNRHSLDERNMFLPPQVQYLVRWTIPREAKKSLWKELRLLGMTKAGLFPDLGHLAVDLKEWHAEQREPASQKSDAPTPNTPVLPPHDRLSQRPTLLPHAPSHRPHGRAGQRGWFPPS